MHQGTEVALCSKGTELLCTQTLPNNNHNALAAAAVDENDEYDDEECHTDGTTWSVCSRYQAVLSA